MPYYEKKKHVSSSVILSEIFATIGFTRKIRDRSTGKIDFVCTELESY